MTQSEGTSQSASGSTSGGSSSASRKRTKKKKATTRARRGAGGAATRRRRKTTTTRRKATGRGKTATRRTRRTATTGRKAATRPRRRRTAGAARRRTSRRTSRPAGLQGILDDLARRANRAGSTIADLSEGGTDAARRTLGTVSETSRQTIATVRREWDKLDNTRRVEFVAGLLAALAAATAGVRTLTKK